MRDPVSGRHSQFHHSRMGQLYNGRILAGILWLIITPVFGWFRRHARMDQCHIIAAYTAYSYAKDHPVRSMTPI